MRPFIRPFMFVIFCGCFGYFIGTPIAYIILIFLFAEQIDSSHPRGSVIPDVDPMRITFFFAGCGLFFVLLLRMRRKKRKVLFGRIN